MARVVASLLVLKLVLVLVLSDTGKTTYNIYETPETIIANGYPAERHKVVTDDGYILEIHRIPHGKGQEQGSSKSIVFLMHGILGASNDFIALGPDYGIAYNLADAGHDVWMGNARGTKNSRNHTSLNPDDPKQKRQFFDFTFEEIGTGDVSASVDYILKVTGQKNLHYIGHSQGGTVFLVLTNLKPEYNEKFKSAHLLAGVGYQDYFPNKKLKNLSLFTDIIYNLGLALGMVELYPPTSKALKEDLEEGYHISELCGGDGNLRHICSMYGLSEVLNNNKSDVGGASLKQLGHFGQNIRDRSFRRWNYGALENLKKYGAIIPPAYNLGLITTNITMHYTISDHLLDERDVLNMVSDLPNAQARKVHKDDFEHGDFVASEDAKDLVTEYIIHAIHTIDISAPSYSDISSNFKFIGDVNVAEVISFNVPDSATSLSFNQIMTSTLTLYIISNCLI